MRLRTSLTIAFFALAALSLAASLLLSSLLIARRPDGAELAWIPAVVGLALVPAAGVFAYLLARGYAAPIETLSRTTEAELESASISVAPEAGDDVERLAENVEALAAQTRIQQAYRERLRRQMEDLLELMSAGVVVLSEDGHVIMANPAAAEILKTQPGELAGRPLVHSARTFPAQPLIEEALAAQAAVRRPVPLPNGRLLTVEAIPLLHTSEEARHVLLLFRDETPRLRTDQMRRDFVANVSHELKTPLTGLSMLASTLEYAVVEDPERAQEFAARISVEIGRLTDLVSDLLTLSRVEEGVPRRELEEWVDLAATARAVEDALRPVFESHERELDVEVAGEVAVAGDRTLLETLIRNLLDNALRYTDPGGHVRLSVARHDSDAQLVVEDDGIGIPKDEQDRIFERFYRVDKARSRQTGGTGLGLSIVRHIVEQHGGRIELDSVLGVGSRFTVTLPLVDPGAGAARPDGEGHGALGERTG